MSNKFSRLTAKQIIQQLNDSGFIEIYQSGSHLKMFNPETKRTAIIPIHGNKQIPISTLKAIEKQANIKFL